MIAILLHQNQKIRANIRWAPPLSLEDAARVEPSLREMRARGYFASLFPEGDGITVSHADYDDERALEDCVAAFPWLSFDESDADASVAERLNRLNARRTVPVTYLVPAETLHITEILNLGPYTIYPPITPFEFTVPDHPRAMELLDVPGADVDPSWDPVSAPEGSLASYLRFPLIEGSTHVDGDLLFPVGSGVIQQEPLTLQVTEHADRVLDVLRFAYCSQDRPHYVPQHAGVLESSFRAAYLKPKVKDIEPGIVVAKSQAFESLNVWLGLEIDAPTTEFESRLATIASGDCANEVEMRVRGALRSRGQSFMLVSPEMKFASLVFAADAIAAVGKKTGKAQRKHVAVVAAAGDAELFRDFLESMIRLYRVRNRIVHNGSSFSDMCEDQVQCVEQMDNIVTSCIRTCMDSDWSSTVELNAAVDSWLNALTK